MLNLTKHTVQVVGLGDARQPVRQAATSLVQDLLVVQTLPPVLERFVPALAQRNPPSREAFLLALGNHVREVGLADTSEPVLEGSLVPYLTSALAESSLAVREAAQGALAAVHDHVPPGVLASMLDSRGVTPAQIAEVERRSDGLNHAAPAAGNAARQCGPSSSCSFALSTLTVSSCAYSNEPCSEDNRISQELIIENAKGQ